jgi:chromosome transmission fidelity protein 4
MIGERGILFACPPENEHPAQVLYKPYTSWSSSSSQNEWTYLLKYGSKVVGLAAGGSKKSKGHKDDSANLVIATSENDLTFMTGNKTEKHVMGLDGEFVSMVAGDDWVFFVYRPGATTIDGWSL